MIKSQKQVIFFKILNISFLILFLFSNSLLFSQETFKNEKYLIVLDVQQYFCDNVLTPGEYEKMINEINTLIDQTNPDKVIYVITPTVAKTLTISSKGLKIDTLISREFDKKLKLVNHTVFEKFEGDAFTAVDLLQYLKIHQVQEIILTGLVAEGCVYETVLGGISNHFNMYIIPDAVGAKTEKGKIKAFKKLVKKGLKITTLNTIINQ
jgi:nicotinamidase-related amidase